MINKDLLDILVCPENHNPLRLADQGLLDQLIAAVSEGSLKNRSDAVVTHTLDGALVREDNEVAYPIVDGIPILLLEEAIPLDQLNN
jgi:uncharacterized protein YbaR (Trm112 family)